MMFSNPAVLLGTSDISRISMCHGKGVSGIDLACLYTDCMCGTHSQGHPICCSICNLLVQALFLSANYTAPMIACLNAHTAYRMCHGCKCKCCLSSALQLEQCIIWVVSVGAGVMHLHLHVTGYKQIMTVREMVCVQPLCLCILCRASC